MIKKFEKWLVNHLMTILQKRYIGQDDEGNIIIDDILLNGKITSEKLSLLLSLCINVKNNSTDITITTETDNIITNMDDDGNDDNDKNYNIVESHHHYISHEKLIRDALFSLGDRVEHRVYQFRGVIYDVDAYFSRDDEWLKSIPAKIRPRKDQPFYHLIAENPDNGELYLAYVSEQNLVKMNDDNDSNWQALENALQEIDNHSQTKDIH